MSTSSEFYKKRFTEIGVILGNIQEEKLPLELADKLLKETEEYIEHLTEMNKIYDQLMSYIEKQGAI